MRCKLLDDNQIPYPVTNYVHINNLTTVVILKESNDGYAIYTNKEMSANNIEIYVDVIFYTISSYLIMLNTGMLDFEDILWLNETQNIRFLIDFIHSGTVQS